MQQVKIDISPEGEVKVEGQNVQGASCQALTKEIEAALGRTVADVKKPEFYKQAHVANAARHQQ